MAEIQKTLIKKRVFNYLKKNISLNFELQEDKQTLKDFKSLLIEARKDIDKILEIIEG